MTITQMWKWLSFLLFIVGMILAVLGGIWWWDTAWIALVLALFGLIIGLIYAIMGSKESNTLLVASIALLVMTGVFAHITWWDIGTKIDQIISYFGTMIAPIAVILAIKALILLGTEKK